MKKEDVKRYISDVISKEEVARWRKGQVITIEAGCGKGKSHFIKNTLYDQAKKSNKKILFLIHRTNCVNQFRMEMLAESKLDLIEIITYQYIEVALKNGKRFDFSKYEYIVSDEFHYFFSDSPWNSYTDISLNAILNETDITRIFMSATGDTVKRYIENIKKIETKHYSLPIDYDFIETLSFYNKDESIYKLAEEAIYKNRKTIFFIQSATKAHELYKRFKNHSMFVCGKSDKHYKHVDQDKLTNMLKNERFEDLILITTTCLDAGVNLKDEELRHVICDVQDINTLIQCIGRKRIMKETDHIYLCIKDISNRQLGGIQRQVNRRMEMADFLRKNTILEYIAKFPRENDKYNMVYTDVDESDKSKATLKINDLMYFKCMLDHAEMSLMTFNDTIEYGYAKYLARKFGFWNEDDNFYDYDIVEVEEDIKNLVEYLESIVGKEMMNLPDRKELIEKINVRQDSKLLKSKESLNAALREKNIDYYIKSFNTSRMIDGKKKNYKSVWKVMKLVDK